MREPVNRTLNQLLNTFDQTHFWCCVSSMEFQPKCSSQLYPNKFRTLLVTFDIATLVLTLEAVATQSIFTRYRTDSNLATRSLVSKQPFSFANFYLIASVQFWRVQGRSWTSANIQTHRQYPWQGCKNSNPNHQFWRLRS